MALTNGTNAVANGITDHTNGASKIKNKAALKRAKQKAKREAASRDSSVVRALCASTLRRAV